MNLSSQIAKHFRDVFFGGNWTSVNLKQTVEDVSWQQATVQVNGFNSIATLVYHMHYYVRVVKKVLEGEALNASDQYSFDLPPITSAADWDNLLDTVWRDAAGFAALVEQLPEQQMGELFADEKYGTYYRNIHGIIEHTHYHLGQITLIKKLLATTNP
ncbi:MAG: DinB family protein [Ferruginibacter sp.]